MLQFGQMKEDFSDILEGYVLGNWPESEIILRHWLGIPTKNTPIFAWAGFPTFIDNFNTNVWKHQCFSIHFSTGELKYFLNEEKKDVFKDFKEEIEKFPRYFDFISLGSKIKSTVSQCTDMQMFAQELSESQMIAYTNCEEFLRGDMLSWGEIPWVLAGNRQVSELEYLDLQKQICSPQDSSLILIPFPLKKEKFGEQMCSKMSGAVASYTSEQDLEFIINFLANNNNLIEKECIKKVSETENE